jgi:hypothetical protein
MRAGFSLDAGGVSPIAAISAEAPIRYHMNGFVNVQAGLGTSSLTNADSSIALSLGVTYSLILNGYRRSQCEPAPDYNRFEIYLESGLATSIFDPRTLDANPNRLQHYFHPMAIIGIRIHDVSPKWIYICKPRFTPFLSKNMPLWAGLSVGIGWQ